MNLDIGSIAYLFFRLSSYIIVLFLLLSSLLNQELKGVIYLIGLVLSIGLLNAIPGATTAGNSNAICNIVSIQGSSTQIPLHLHMLSFTFVYLTAAIARHKVFDKNIPTMILFPMLVLGEIAWSHTNQCLSNWQLLMGSFVGGLAGYAWDRVVHAMGNPSLEYMGGITSAMESCSMPSKYNFRCKVYRGGLLV
jgi:hypothetical protein